MLRLLALLLPLALDTFAVSAALGLVPLSSRRRTGLSLMFALFEGGMPAVGLAVGAAAGQLIGRAADDLAIVALVGLGFRMLLAGDEAEERRIERLAASRGLPLLVLAAGVSLDELAIGFSLGAIGVPVVPALLLMAAQAFLASQIGFRLGGRVGEGLREGAERAAGVALIAVGGLLLAARLLGLPF